MGFASGNVWVLGGHQDRKLQVSMSRNSQRWTIDLLYFFS